MTSRGLPIVFIVGGSGRDLRSAGPVPGYETQELDCRHFSSDREMLAALPFVTPQAIVTFGDLADLPELNAAPYALRRRWIHLPVEPEPEVAGAQALHCFLDDALSPPRADAAPLISVFTPAYRTGTRIERPLTSLLAQTYSNWEWVVLDDSHDDDETWRMLNGIADREHRIQLYRQRARSGNIGELKNKLGHLAQGQYIVELDHDDELTPQALQWVAEAFAAHPEAGYAYTDCAEVFENGTNATYGEDWGFGYGVTVPRRCLTKDGHRDLLVHQAPPVNAKTIRHIVSTPNHLRAWRRDFYLDIGGHNRKLHVADDYEICVRSFLHTRMVRIAELGYIQYYNEAGNTQRVRNQEIQRLVRRTRDHYDPQIHDRLLELGVDDFCWDARLGRSDFAVPNTPESFGHDAALTYVPQSAQAERITLTSA